MAVLLSQAYPWSPGITQRKKRKQLGGLLPPPGQLGPLLPLPTAPSPAGSQVPALPQAQKVPLPERHTLQPGPIGPSTQPGVNLINPPKPTYPAATPATPSPGPAAGAWEYNIWLHGEHPELFRPLEAGGKAPAYMTAEERQRRRLGPLPARGPEGAGLEAYESYLREHEAGRTAIAPKETEGAARHELPGPSTAWTERHTPYNMPPPSYERGRLGTPGVIGPMTPPSWTPEQRAAHEAYQESAAARRAEVEEALGPRKGAPRETAAADLSALPRAGLARVPYLPELRTIGGELFKRIPGAPITGEGATPEQWGSWEGLMREYLQQNYGLSGDQADMYTQRTRSRMAPPGYPESRIAAPPTISAREGPLAVGAGAAGGAVGRARTAAMGGAVTPAKAVTPLPTHTAAGAAPVATRALPATGAAAAPVSETLTGLGGAEMAGQPNEFIQSIWEQMQSGQEAARAANEQRYQEILDLLSGLGEQQAADIEERGRMRLAALGQQMVSAGMAGTTVPWAGEALAERETSAELRRLAEDLAAMKAGFIERRADVYPDTEMLTELLRQYGQAAGAGAFGEIAPTAAGAAAPTRGVAPVEGRAMTWEEGTIPSIAVAGGQIARVGEGGGGPPTSDYQASILRHNISQQEELVEALRRAAGTTITSRKYDLTAQLQQAEQDLREMRQDLDRYERGKETAASEAERLAEWERVAGATGLPAPWTVVPESMQGPRVTVRGPRLPTRETGPAEGFPPRSYVPPIEPYGARGARSNLPSEILYANQIQAYNRAVQEDKAREYAKRVEREREELREINKARKRAGLEPLERLGILG